MVWSSQIPSPLIIGGNGVVGQIIVEDANGQAIFDLMGDGNTIIENSSRTGRLEFRPNGAVGYGSYPGIYFYTANTSGGYAGAAFIQANPDSNSSPQLGINSGQYTDTSGLHAARGRMFMADHIITIANIDVTSQAEIGGSIELSDTQALMNYTDPASGTKVGILVGNLNSFASSVPILSGTWTNVTMKNGWTASPGQARVTVEGLTHLRGTVTPGTTADGTLIATIPAAMAPHRTVTVGVAVLAGANPTVLTRMQIDTSGNIFVYGAGSPVTAVCWDNVTFDNTTWTA